MDRNLIDYEPLGVVKPSPEFIVVGVRETRMPWAHVRPRDGLWAEQSINLPA